MQGSSVSKKNKGLSIRSSMLLLTIAAFCGMLLVTGICMILINEVKIGSTAYSDLKQRLTAMEKSAALRSDLYLIQQESQDSAVSDRDNQRSNINKLSKDIDSQFIQLRGLIDSPGSQEQLVKAQSSWREYSRLLKGEAAPASLSLQSSQPTAITQPERLKNCVATLSSLTSTLQSEISSIEKKASSVIRLKTMTAVVAILIITAIFGFMAHLASESIHHPIRACIEFAQNIASGRLDSRITNKSSGEAGLLMEALNFMAEKLEAFFSKTKIAADKISNLETSLGKATHQMSLSAQRQEIALHEASRSADQISGTADEISGGIKKLSIAASESSSSILQMSASVDEVAMSADKLGGSVDEVSSSIIEMAASIKEIGFSIVNLLGAAGSTASSVAEMDNTIKQVEKNAMDTAAISEGVKLDAETGKKAVEEAIAGIQAIRNSSRITVEVVENLSLRVNDIGAILSVIDEVAEQTNLLALNAAIIAAQAGEYGKGFAVVADEIRELAERTSSSTREIAAVIQGVQDETSRAVTAISQAEESVTEGEKLSERSGVALEKIYSGVQRASLQIREIALATVEQAKGSKSIKESMESVSEMVGHIAKSANEHSITGELITHSVENMKNLTNHVRLSAREQSKASSLIADSAESINALINKIESACNAQREASGQSRKTMESMAVSTTSTIVSLKTLETQATQLGKQVVLLQKEI